MVKRGARCLFAALAVIALFGGGPARAQVDTCSLAEDVLGQFWRIFNSGFAGIDSCALELESGGLQITNITIVEYASVAEADEFLALYSPVGASSLDIGDTGTSFISPNAPTEQHVVSFRQGNYGVSVGDTADYSFALEVARALEVRLPLGSVPEPEVDSTTGGTSSTSSGGGSSSGSSSSDSGIPPEAVIVGGLALGAGGLTAVGVALRSGRRRAADPNARPEPTERPECVGVLADRAELEAAIGTLRDQQHEHQRRLKTIAGDRGELSRLQHRVAGLTPSSVWSGGFVSTLATGVGIGVDLKGAEAIAGQAVGAVGTATNVFAHARESGRQNRSTELASVNQRIDLIQQSLADQDQAARDLTRKLDGAEDSLRHRVEHWNRAHEQFTCAGNPLGFDRADTPTPSSQGPDITEHDQSACSGLAQRIAEHAQRVAQAEPRHRQRLEQRADLNGKIDALTQYHIHISRLWLELAATIRLRNAQADDATDAGHVMNFGGLGLALLTLWGPASLGLGTIVGGLNFAASVAFSGLGPSEQELALRGRYHALGLRLATVRKRVTAETLRMRTETMNAARPLHQEANQLRAQKRACRFYLSGQSAALPPIADLTTVPPGEPSWVRAKHHLPPGDRRSWTAAQIIDFMQRAQAW